VAVSGQLTWRTSRRLHASFRRVVDEGGRELRVDLRSVSEADPAGVAVLLVYARLLPTLGGTLEVSGASGPCEALLHRMQLSHLLDPPQGVPAAAVHPGRAVSDRTDVPRPRGDRSRARSTAVLEGAS
jgi:ABC-type transporter Mla MlaB component